MPSARLRLPRGRVQCVLQATEAALQVGVQLGHFNPVKTRVHTWKVFFDLAHELPETARRGQ